MMGSWYVEVNDIGIGKAWGLYPGKVLALRFQSGESGNFEGKCIYEGEGRFRGNGPLTYIAHKEGAHWISIDHFVNKDYTIHVEGEAVDYFT